MERAALRELACSGALDEISNAEDGVSIERAIARGGLVKDEKTQSATLFVVYQTGRVGPQNGFRLALIHEGVKPESAKDELKGNVEQDSAEFVIIRPESLAISDRG